jgi:PAS domain S-box-containing protein
MNARRLDSRFFPLVLDVVGQGVFTVDRSGRITSFNRAAEEITGYTASEILGEQCSDIFRTELCDKECPLGRAIRSRGRIRGREVEIQVRDGRRIRISVDTAPLETRTGRLIGGVEVITDLSPIQGLRRALSDRYRFEDIISKNAEMHRIFTLLPMAADSHSTVLITGPSGCGKELVARSIHNHGPRHHRRFVAVNCAALPETLLESELFGYVKGAFTGATSDHPGRISRAERGTLLIDEVADLPKHLQVKLLRFLQERVYEPLGSTESIHADVRILAATNRDLPGMVATGEFREDLFYRLNVLQITLPPLRDRTEDIPLLVRHFIGRFRLETGRAIKGITDDALAALARYSFPGNVRELENIVERAFVLCPGEQICLADLPETVVRIGDSPTVPIGDRGSLEEAGARAIRIALDHHDGNRTRAAADLGIHRSTLIRKMKRYGLT